MRLAPIIAVALACFGCVRPPGGRIEQTPTISLKRPAGLSIWKEISGDVLGGRLRHPGGVAVDPQGNLYIADTGNHRIIKLNPGMEPLKDFGGYGSDVGRFSSPTDLYLDRGLNLYILDSGNRRVVRLDLNLNYVDEIRPENDSSDLRLSVGLLTGLAVSSLGEVAVADYDNSRLIRLDNFGRFNSYIGDFSYGKGALQNPEGMAIDRKDNLFIADSRNHRIAIYDYYGNFVRQIGQDTLMYPSAVACGPDGSVWVADKESDYLLSFSPESELLFSTEKSDRNDYSFSDIEALVVYNERLVVADAGHDRVLILRIE